MDYRHQPVYICATISREWLEDKGALHIDIHVCNNVHTELSSKGEKSSFSSYK